MGDEVYKRLAKHLSSLGMGYPEKEELLEILKENFTPLEAEVALAIPTKVIPLEPVPVAKITPPQNVSMEELESILSNLAQRGLLFSKKMKDGGMSYALQQFGYGFPQTFFWRGVNTPNAKKMAELVAKYSGKEQLKEAYGSTNTKAFRYVPATPSFEPESHAVFPFEMMEKVIEKVKVIALVHCPCRATAHLIGKKRCDHPLENCIKYDELAEYLIEKDIGREITKKEALEVIRKSEEAGLVHLVDNAREGIKHTCNCCGCCCWSVGTIRRKKIPRDVLMATYFLRETDQDRCTGCGQCVEICPVNVVKMEGDFPVIDKDWCIGCGVCAIPCPASAVKLVRKSDAIPPKDFKELHQEILKERRLLLTPSPLPHGERGRVRGWRMRLLRLRLAMTACFVILLTLVSFTPTLLSQDFKRALPGRAFSFPQDHFSHPEFKTEWWYYSGHLQSQTQDKRSFGYQLTFFRTGLTRQTKHQKSKWLIKDLYFAHLAITDESRGKFEYLERISRGSLGEAGASFYKTGEKTFRIWIEDWSVEGKGHSMQNHSLHAGDKKFGIELMLIPEKNPVIHGQNGISQKAEGEGYASHYYSIPRLKTEGKIFLQNKEVPVQGISWMDHEFGSSQLREYQVGWDWFSIQLDNRMELMFYQIRHRDGKIDSYSSGTIIFPDGTYKHLPKKEFQIEVLDRWKSSKSGAVYPSKWRIRVPAHQIELTLSPTVKDQELVTKESTRVTYWEGSVKVEGKYQGSPINGLGYAELTGYAKPFSKGI